MTLCDGAIRYSSGKDCGQLRGWTHGCCSEFPAVLRGTHRVPKNEGTAELRGCLVGRQGFYGRIHLRLRPGYRGGADKQSKDSSPVKARARVDFRLTCHLAKMTLRVPRKGTANFRIPLRRRRLRCRRRRCFNPAPRKQRRANKGFEIYRDISEPLPPSAVSVAGWPPWPRLWREVQGRSAGS